MNIEGSDETRVMPWAEGESFIFDLYNHEV
ncbi:MAG: hypothetical protein P0Y59_21815 [Candidatus Sphingomonas phytovorans]|nr:hypothetical protein [Sphingomonas sp.]WEK02652.1 MAG: hypothetical protein P0Y59_21815 [Sphingomonas sp.]